MGTSERAAPEGGTRDRREKHAEQKKAPRCRGRTSRFEKERPEKRDLAEGSGNPTLQKPSIASRI